MSEVTPYRLIHAGRHVALFASILAMASALLMVAPAQAEEADPSQTAHLEAQAEPMLWLTLMPLVGSHSMTFSGDTSTITQDTLPYFGAGLELAGVLARFPSLDASLRLNLEAGWGTGTGTVADPDIEEKPEATLSYVDGQLVLQRVLSPYTELGVGLGAHVTSFTLAANPAYTGHRFISAALSVTMRRWLMERAFFADAHIAALPIVSLNQSDGAYDEGTGFGVRLGATLGWSPSGMPLDITARYRYQRFRTQFPRASIGSRGGASEDDQHMIAVGVGYSL